VLELLGFAELLLLAIAEVLIIWVLHEAPLTPTLVPATVGREADPTCA